MPLGEDEAQFMYSGREMSIHVDGRDFLIPVGTETYEAKRIPTYPGPGTIIYVKRRTK